MHVALICAAAGQSVIQLMVMGFVVASACLGDWRFPCWFAVVDYDAIRAQAHSLRISKVEEVRGLVSKLQKAQRAAEHALDLCDPADYTACVLATMVELWWQASQEMRLEDSSLWSYATTKRQGPMARCSSDFDLSVGRHTVGVLRPCGNVGPAIWMPAVWMTCR